MKVNINDLIEFKYGEEKMMGIVKLIDEYSNVVKYVKANVRISEDRNVDILYDDIIHNFGRCLYTDMNSTNTEVKLVVEVNEGIYVNKYNVMTREITLTSNIGHATRFEYAMDPNVEWLKEYTGGKEKMVSVVIVE